MCNSSSCKSKIRFPWLPKVSLRLLLQDWANFFAVNIRGKYSLKLRIPCPDPFVPDFGLWLSAKSLFPTKKCLEELRGSSTYLEERCSERRIFHLITLNNWGQGQEQSCLIEGWWQKWQKILYRMLVPGPEGPLTNDSCWLKHFCLEEEQMGGTNLIVWWTWSWRRLDEAFLWVPTIDVLLPLRQ